MIVTILHKVRGCDFMKTLQDIKKDALNEEDPEVAIEKAMINTCCLIRELSFKELDKTNLFYNLGVNTVVGIVAVLEEESRFKTKSWRASK